VRPIFLNNFLLLFYCQTHVLIVSSPPEASMTRRFSF
jgi:hypothetical protein